MGVAVGPIEMLGHPFRVVTEVPVRREIGDHIVYAFGTKWLYTSLDVVPDDPIEAVVIWDPGWLRTGEGEGATNEIKAIWDLAQEHDAPVIGLYSDWFAAWKVDTGIVGTLGSTMFCDAIIVDPAGAASLRAGVHPLRVQDPMDHRFRPIVEMDSFLTYGRLPRIGGGVEAEMKPFSEREIDVAMVSTLHPQHVVLRPYYVERLKEMCALHGWSFEFRDRASAEEMEELYLNSKVVANVSLGSQPNCRVSEALACGCVLVSDAWNIGMWDVPYMPFKDAETLEIRLFQILLDNARGSSLQEAGLDWARRNTPEQVWERVLDRAMLAVPHTREARVARERMAEEIRKERDAVHN